MSKLKDSTIDKFISNFIDPKNPIKFIEIKTFPRVAIFEDYSGSEIQIFEMNYELLELRIKNLTAKGIDTTEERVAYAGFNLDGTSCYDVAMKIIKRWLNEKKLDFIDELEHNKGK